MQNASTPKARRRPTSPTHPLRVGLQRAGDSPLSAQHAQGERASPLSACSLAPIFLRRFPSVPSLHGSSHEDVRRVHGCPGTLLHTPGTGPACSALLLSARVGTRCVCARNVHARSAQAPASAAPPLRRRLRRRARRRTVRHLFGFGLRERVGLPCPTTHSRPPVPRRLCFVCTSGLQKAEGSAKITRCWHQDGGDATGAGGTKCTAASSRYSAPVSPAFCPVCVHVHRRPAWPLAPSPGAAPLPPPCCALLDA